MTCHPERSAAQSRDLQLSFAHSIQRCVIPERSAFGRGSPSAGFLNRGVIQSEARLERQEPKFLIDVSSSTERVRGPRGCIAWGQRSEGPAFAVFLNRPPRNLYLRRRYNVFPLKGMRTPIADCSMNGYSASRPPKPTNPSREFGPEIRTSHWLKAWH